MCSREFHKHWAASWEQTPVHSQLTALFFPLQKQPSALTESKILQILNKNNQNL